MTWIQTVPPEQAGPPLRDYYDQLRAQYPPEYGPDVAAVRRPDGTSDSIVAALSLIPEAMVHAFATHLATMGPDLPLTRRQQEMIATVVSALNGCFY